MVISTGFISYLWLIDLSATFYPTPSVSAVLSRDHLVKLLHAAYKLEDCKLLQPDKGRRIACEFKDCLSISSFDAQEWRHRPDRVRREVANHVQGHLSALGGDSIRTPVLWKDVPLGRSSDDLDIFPCFWRCIDMMEAPKGAQLLEHLVRDHHRGYAMYSCPMCKMNLALEAEADVPSHVRANMVLIITPPNTTKTVDGPDAQAQAILLKHYKEGCPEFSPRTSPLWDDLPDNVRQRLDKKFEALAALSFYVGRQSATIRCHTIL
ncbi:uncharacterized protein SCHCODRAFT_02693137 [Schizophyllum commune H4-8]|uniref:Uncharacterized protein n=1 Tax=Schizophyllum commune (strain H4-8 / FGSC 9210) TaxID=578458 RepID=D8QJG1_SCHCM|nr:uncharacterized protein SCHCODRAFT_02693137 [Schizophyllum commune H4-8]KAI5886345.1 hypothetical protein SCHCODRAFT_02693137 [Schizophyllum commune H4-8]